MAPPECVLHAAAPMPTVKVDPKLMYAALTRDFEKDWARAQKLCRQNNLPHCKKILVHIVRMHLLYLQIKEHGTITDFAAANPYREEFSLLPWTSWPMLAARYEW